MYNGEMNEKIKLLYRLHIPPGKKVQVAKSDCALLKHNTGFVHDSEALLFLRFTYARGNTCFSLGVSGRRFEVLCCTALAGAPKLECAPESPGRPV